MLKLFTTHCPNCRVVEAKLKVANIPYEVESNPCTVLEEADKAQLATVPFALVDSTYLHGTKLENYIKNYQEEA